MEADGLSALGSVVSAGVAFLALVVAIVAAFATWRTNRAQQQTLELQRQQFAAAEERAERDQASKVTFVQSGRGMAEPVQNEHGGSSVTVHGHDSAALLNASETPVFLLIIYERKRTKQGYSTHILAERENLMPTGAESVELPFERPASWFISDVGLYFRDAAGVEWTRSETGKLSRIGDNELSDVMQALAAHHSTANTLDRLLATGADPFNARWAGRPDDQADDPPDQGSDSVEPVKP